MIQCPHCGADMPEEALFCESCGKERQLVPDYEAEVNQSMDETISTIAVELANTQEIVPQDLARDAVIREQIYKEKTAAEIEDGTSKEAGALSQLTDKELPGKVEKLRREKKAKAGKTYGGGSVEPSYGRGGAKLTLFLLLGSVTVVLIMAGLMSFWMYKSNSSTYEYQLTQARYYEEQGDYEQMLTYARKASEIAANSSDAKMLMAKAYAGLGRTDEEKIVLEGLILTDPAFYEAYHILIPMYEKAGEYDQIAQILLTCPDQSVIDKYSDYLASPPEFSMPPGTYEEMISVKILASGSGTIYYTVDGTEPTEESSVYSMPLILEDGTIKVRAVYKNSYGIISEEASAKYEIHTEQSDTALPIVSLPSDTYTTPQVISVFAPEAPEVPEQAEGTDATEETAAAEGKSYQIYYTTNGTKPGLDSQLYKKPIPLPLGNSEFQFVLYDDEGNASEAVTYEYHFSMDLPLTSQQAVNLLMQALISSGVVLDAQGSIPGGEGRRSYEAVSVFARGEENFYLLEERYDSGDGAKRTGNYFGVSVVTGQSYSVTETEAGAFQLSGL